MPGQDRVAVLDGFRGLAAVGVLAFHFCGMFGIGRLQHAYLAVDLFFLMSGFVLAQAYEGRLRTGMTLGQFASKRLARLYPVYALGILLAIVTSYLASSLSGVAHAEKPIAVSGGLSLLMLPSPYGTAAFAFPLNPPAWSLFYEMLIGLAYAALARRLSNRALHLVIVCSGLVLVGAVVQFGGAGFGSRTEDFLGALARVAFPFSVGVRLFRLKRDGRLDSLPPIPPWLLMAALAATLAAPSVGPPAAFDLPVMLAGFPLLCAVAVRSECGDRTGAALARLGAISYPLYLTHAPVLSAFGSAAVWGRLPPAPVVAVGGGLAVVFAWAVGRYFETPLRRRLEHYLADRALRRPALAPTAP